MFILDFLRGFFSNYVLISAICGWLVAQMGKMIVGLFSGHRVNPIKMLISNGGMPSSHSATVWALATACLIIYGVDSPYFAMSAVFAFIVMNDAASVRYQTGEQSKILNRMVKEVFPDTDEENPPPHLKELVGHTPLQIAMGAVVGVLVAVALGFLMGVIAL